MSGSLRGELERAVPGCEVRDDRAALATVSRDATGSRGISGRADLLALPEDAEQVAAVLAWCYDRELPLTVRGGGTGFAAAAVPDGGVVLSLERMNRIRSIDPGLWRMEAEAGCTTGQVRRVALEHGLLFPPDPGAAESSSLGGNIATNAGGPHAYRYGVTGNWITGLEAVVAPGRPARFGGPWRKDVSGYDLTHLMVGSEGTLGIVTAAWLRLVPAPEARSVAAAFFADAEAGCAALGAVAAAGIQATALEFLDRGALEAGLPSFPFEAPAGAGFMVLAEADGEPAETARVAAQLAEVLGETAMAPVVELHGAAGRGEAEALWRWRDGVSLAVTARRGGKVSEDVVVPVDRLAALIEGTVEIGRRHRLEACAWGHGGDGNAHATFLIDPERPEQLERAERAAGDLFALALELGGSISGEHGIGTLKAPWVARALDPVALDLQYRLKRAFDPKGLLNPGKKLPPPPNPGDLHYLGASPAPK